MVGREIDKTASNIQARSFVGRKMQHGAIEKPKLDNARRLRSIYFIDPETLSSKNDRKCAEKVGTPDGTCYALQDEVQRMRS